MWFYQLHSNSLHKRSLAHPSTCTADYWLILVKYSLGYDLINFHNLIIPRQKGIFTYVLQVRFDPRLKEREICYGLADRRFKKWDIYTLISEASYLSFVF